jgi:dTMP kinase
VDLRTSGKLIVLEGIDGAGTTTQAARLARAYGAAVHVTREPSDGPVGVEIRRILRGAHAPFDHRALALLFAADRVDHLAREVEPLLARGIHVVSDRYLISSYVYQGRFVEPEFVHAINQAARAADLTLFLQVPVEVATARRHGRGQAEELFEEVALQAEIARGYELETARLGERERVLVVDGSRDTDAVFGAVLGAVESCIGPPTLPSSS